MRFIRFRVWRTRSDDVRISDFRPLHLSVAYTVWTFSISSDRHHRVIGCCAFECSPSKLIPFYPYQRIESDVPHWYKIFAYFNVTKRFWRLRRTSVQKRLNGYLFPSREIVNFCEIRIGCCLYIYIHLTARSAALHWNSLTGTKTVWVKEP